MSIYPFLHPDQCLSYKFPTSVFPACEFPVTFSNALSASSFLMFFNAFSYTFSCSFLKCFSGAFTLYENYSSTPEKYKTGENPDVHPVLCQLRYAFCNVLRLFSTGFAALSATGSACFHPPLVSAFFRLSVSLLLSSLSTLLFFLPYKIMQTIPPLLSFTIFCMVSCSFIWHSSSIIEILPRMPSSISSPMDFPKILVSQAPSSLFSPSLM